MQNKFLTDLVTRLSRNATTVNPTFTFQSFEKAADLQTCLNSRVCTAALDYEQQIKSSSQASLFKQPLPALTDKVLYVNNKNLKEPVFTAFFMTLWWIIGLGGVSFFAALFFGRNEFLNKPERLNVRDTPLYKPRISRE